MLLEGFLSEHSDLGGSGATARLVELVNFEVGTLLWDDLKGAGLAPQSLETSRRVD